MNSHVITLDPAGESYLGFEAAATAAGLTVSIFPAVDASAIQPDDPLALQTAGWFPGITRGAVGATLSHLQLWREIAAGDEPILIFEDDARPLSALWDDQQIAEALAGSDLVLLHVNSAEGGGSGIVSFRPHWSHSTAAYALTPTGARKLLEFSRVPVPADLSADIPTFEQNGRTWFHRVPYVVDVFIRHASQSGLTVTVILPSPVAHSGIESTIATDDYLLPPPALNEEEPDLPLPILKRRRMRAATNFFEARLRDGIEVNGVRLPALPSDRAAYAELLLLLREAHDLQPDAAAKAAFRALKHKIIDATGTARDLDLLELRELLVQYGLTYKTLWDQHTTRLTEIQSATTRAELAQVGN
jgi:GR25 family glycosyltransferase involved in LPS biosynthesis